MEETDDLEPTRVSASASYSSHRRDTPRRSWPFVISGSSATCWGI